MSLELEVGPLAELPPGTMKPSSRTSRSDRRLQLRRARCTRSRIAAPTTTGRSASATGTSRAARSSVPRHGASFDLGRAGRCAAGVPAGADVPGAGRGRRRQGRGRLLTAVPRRPLLADRRPGLRRYHDEEWGRPVRDERGVYERLCLEGFQSGLSWLTILRKRRGVPGGVRRLRPGPSSPRSAKPTSSGCSATRGSCVTAGRSRRRSRTRGRPSPCATAASRCRSSSGVTRRRRSGPRRRRPPTGCRRRPSRPRSPSDCARRASGSSARRRCMRRCKPAGS